MKTNEISKVVSTMDFRVDQFAKLRAAFGNADIEIVDCQSGRLLDPILETADVAFLTADVSPNHLMHPNLKWVHIDTAGLNKFAKPQLLQEGPVITGSAGRSAPVLAEHAVMFMLSFAYQIPKVLDAQRKRSWGFVGQNDLRGLYGQTVGIVGMGNTGQEIASRCKSFGMKVIGYSRSTKTIDQLDSVYCSENGDSLEPLLAEADFLILCLSLTNESVGMIGQDELSAMKSDAVLINLARGEVVDEAALIKALKAGTIGGAGLDVFQTEPLPTESDLWSLPNVMITPHFTPSMPDRLEQSLEIILENIGRFQAGLPLLNQIRTQDLYDTPTKRP